MFENTTLIILHETLSNKKISLTKASKKYSLKLPNLVATKSYKFWVFDFTADGGTHYKQPSATSRY